MGKVKKGKKKGTVKYDEEKEDTHVPDAKSNEYFYDDVDTFHNERNKIPLSNIEPAGFSSSEEDILKVGESDSDDDEEIEAYKAQLKRIRAKTFKQKHASDLEESSEEEDDKAWGQKRKKFYGGDVTDEDDEGVSEDDEEATAILEEKEALSIQKKIAEEMDEDDFIPEIFKKKKVKTKDDDEKIQKDLSKMTESEKRRLLEEEAPELFGLVEEYKKRMEEIDTVLLHLAELVKKGKLKDEPKGFSEYVTYKTNVTSGYCMNISFYLALKARGIAVENHPVIERILGYRKILNKLADSDNTFIDFLKETLENLENNKNIEFADETPLEIPTTSRKKSKRRRTVIETEDLEDYDQPEPSGGSAKNRKRRKGEGEKIPKEKELGEDDKRAITYQMSKNKGLTPNRKKINRNPRVKLREKFRKAKIRRKGMMREVRTEVDRYGGELSGIRAGVKKSVKFK